MLRILRPVTICLALLGLSTLPSPADATSSLSGGQVIGIQQSQSTCIVPSKQSVSITITSVRVPSDAPWPTWLKKVKAIGAKVDLTITGPTGTNEKASFPIAKLVTQIAPDNAKPIIRATVNVSILTKYKLSDQSGTYAHIDMPLTLVKIDDNKGMQNLISALTKVANTVKIPASPFGAGLQAFGTLASDLFTSTTDTSTSYPNAEIGFELVDDDTQCAGNSLALRTGAQALIFTSPHAGAGIIDIGDYGKYCFYSTGGIDPNVIYSHRSGDNSCPDAAPAGSITLNNPQIIYVVNAYPFKTSPGVTQVDVAPNVAGAAAQIASNKGAAAAFGAFATTAQQQASVAPQKVSTSDALSLSKKLEGGKGIGGPRRINVTANERGALVLINALNNCKLAGLSPSECN